MQNTFTTSVAVTETLAGALSRALFFMLVLVAWGHAGAEQRFESDRYSFTVAEVPGWVSEVKAPQFERSAVSKGEATHYLLSEWQNRVDDGGGRSEFTHIAYVPMTESALEDGSSISIDFHPQYESLQLHYVTLIRDGKRSERLQPRKVRLIQQERDIDKLMYNGTVTALIVLDDVRTGDVVEYAYSVQGGNPVFGDKYFASHSLGWQVGVDLVQFRVLAGADRKLRTRSYNTDVEPTVARVDGMKAYTWKLEHVRPLVDEGDYPDWYNPYPWVQVSEYRNWKEVNQWATRLFRYQGELSPELRTKIAAWRKTAEDDHDAVRMALKFVQDEVRYFGVELGQNSHRPSHPSEVFTRRYGDCKDKALLLSAILHEWGIKAWPALVSAGSHRAVADWLPSPGAFDHVIVKAQIDGRQYWLDGTSTYQRGALDQRGVPGYGKALLVGSRMRNLDDITIPRGYEPTIDVEEYFLVRDYQEPVEFTVKSVFTYGEAEWKRAYFANRTLDEIANRYVNFYASIYPGIEMAEPISFQDDEENNVVTVVEKYRIHDFWERKEGRMYHTFYGSTVKDYTSLPRIINRKMPLAMTFPLHVSHTSVLEYPEDINFDDIADTTEIKDDVIDFTLTSSYEDRRLKVQYDLISRADAVLPDKMAPHMAKRRRVNDNLYFSAWITDEEYFAKADDSRRNRMKNFLSSLVAGNDK